MAVGEEQIREERHLMGLRWGLVLDLSADQTIYHFSFSLVNVAPDYAGADLRVDERWSVDRSGRYASNSRYCYRPGERIDRGDLVRGPEYEFQRSRATFRPVFVHDTLTTVAGKLVEPFLREVNEDLLTCFREKRGETRK